MTSWEGFSPSSWFSFSVPRFAWTVFHFVIHHPFSFFFALFLFHCYSHWFPFQSVFLVSEEGWRNSIQDTCLKNTEFNDVSFKGDPSKDIDCCFNRSELLTAEQSLTSCFKLSSQKRVFRERRILKITPWITEWTSLQHPLNYFEIKRIWAEEKSDVKWNVIGTGMYF